MMVIDQRGSIEKDLVTAFQDLVTQVVVFAAGEAIALVESADAVKNILSDGAIITAKGPHKIALELFVTIQDLAMNAIRQHVLLVDDAVAAGDGAHLFPVEGPHKPRDPIFMGNAIRVRKTNDLSRGVPHALVARRGRPGVFLLTIHDAGETSDDPRGAVGRSVVYDNDFQIGKVLGEKRLNGGANRFFPVKDGDDDASPSTY